MLGYSSLAGLGLFVLAWLGCSTLPLGSIRAQVALECRVPSILDGIVGASGQTFGNLGPSISKLGVSLNEGFVFTVRPLALVDARIEMIVPSLSTLLA